MINIDKLTDKSLHIDGYEAFTETGDIFNPEVAARVKKYIYSAGNSQDPAELYRLFRGRYMTPLFLVTTFLHNMRNI